MSPLALVLLTAAALALLGTVASQPLRLDLIDNITSSPAVPAFAPGVAIAIKTTAESRAISYKLALEQANGGVPIAPLKAPDGSLEAAGASAAPGCYVLVSGGARATAQSDSSIGRCMYV